MDQPTNVFFVEAHSCRPPSAYVGDDYPERFDSELPPSNPVALVVEDPVHYPVQGPAALQEWASSSPGGVFYIRLGPEHRTFALSMMHELHCLRNMRAALGGARDRRRGPDVQAHFTHCLQYLRQFVLCEPDLTLEPPDVLEWDFAGGVKVPESVHVCKDWEQVYGAMGASWEEWVRVRGDYGYGS